MSEVISAPVKNHIIESLLAEMTDPEQLQIASLDAIGSVREKLEEAVGLTGEIPLRFEWPFEAREFILLIRNIYFRVYRDLLLYEDKSIQKEDIRLHNTASAELLQKVFNDLEESYQSANSFASDHKNDEIKKWKNFISPVATVLQDTNEIEGQIHLIYNTGKQLSHFFTVILDVRDQIDQFTSRLGEQSEIIEAFITDVMDGIKALHQDVEQKEIQKIVNLLDKLIVQLNEIKSHEFIIDTTGIRDLPEDIPVGLSGQQLIVKPKQVGKALNRWIETDIQLQLLDIHGKIVMECDRTLMAFFNTKNRLGILLKDFGEDTIIPQEVLLSPLKKLESSLLNFDQEIEEAIESVNDKAAKNLRISNIFEQENYFFDADSSVAVEQYTYKANRWLQSRRLKSLHQGIRDFPGLKRLLRPSSGEDLIPYLDSFLLDEVDQHSHSLFLDKGYLGNSFTFQRLEITEAISRQYAHWKDGFAASVLVHGTYLSGKSTILQSIENFQWDHRVIHLNPDSVVLFNGRKFSTERNLKASIEFIYANAYHAPVIVCIDDIHKWRSDSISLYENVQALMQTIDKYRKRLLFVVSANNWIKKLLDNYLDLSGHFNIVVRTDRMDENDISKVILVRHNATLLGESMEQTDKLLDKIEKNARKIARKNHGNIGASLQAWYRNVISEKREFDISPEDCGFVDLIKKHSETLAFFLKFGAGSEHEISALLGTPVAQSLRASIDRLLGLKILVRSLEGRVHINPLLIAQIEYNIYVQLTNKIRQYDVI